MLGVIPEAEWADRIRDGQGSFLSDWRKDVLEPHDQGQTNYCWAHGTTRTLEVLRCWNGQEPLLLSAESVAVPLTGGRNRGGTATEAIERLASHGACRQEMWPANSRDEDDATDGWEDDARQHAVIAWVEVTTWEEQITCALLRLPVAIGLSWWGHLVCQLDPVILDDGSIGIGCDNSWGPEYGDNGYFTLTRRRGTAGLGAYAPISATWSEKP